MIKIGDLVKPKQIDPWDSTLVWNTTGGIIDKVITADVASAIVFEIIMVAGYCLGVVLSSYCVCMFTMNNGTIRLGCFRESDLEHVSTG